MVRIKVFAFTEKSFQALCTAARRPHKSEINLDETGIEEFHEKANNTGKLVGLFANEPALIDQILGQAMGDSENMPLRLDC
jgi:hypothetical protein